MDQLLEEINFGFLTNSCMHRTSWVGWGRHLTRSQTTLKCSGTLTLSILSILRIASHHALMSFVEKNQWMLHGVLIMMINNLLESNKMSTVIMAHREFLSCKFTILMSHVGSFNYNLLHKLKRGRYTMSISMFDIQNGGNSHNVTLSHLAVICLLYTLCLLHITYNIFVICKKVACKLYIVQILAVQSMSEVSKLRLAI